MNYLLYFFLCTVQPRSENIGITCCWEYRQVKGPVLARIMHPKRRYYIKTVCRPSCVNGPLYIVTPNADMYPTCKPGRSVGETIAQYLMYAR